MIHLSKRVFTFQNCKHSFGRCIGIAIDVGVPQPHDAVALAHEMSIAARIACKPRCFAMLTAVDFHNQLVRLAQEIENITIDPRPTTKTIAMAEIAKPIRPELRRRRRETRESLAR